MNSIWSLNDPGYCKKPYPNNLVVSWKQAFNICKSIESALPSFYSRQDLEEFISLVKHTSCGWPPGIFYIGLQTAVNVGVCLNIFSDAVSRSFFVSDSN